MASILGIGECMVELSSAGENLWQQAFSGDVFNALWYARATASDDVSIAFHTALGADPLSDQMLAFGQSAGIDWSNTPRFDDRRPGLYSIHLNGGERSFTYWRDTSAAQLMMQEADLLWAKVKEARIVYFSGITLAILSEVDCYRLLDGLQRHKPVESLIVFDPNIRPHLWQDKDRMRALISRAASISDIVMPSFDDETSAFGDKTPSETASRYSALGVNHVVVKNGSDDIVHLMDGKISFYSVVDVDDAVDTTAAGDSFNGSYIAAILSDYSPDDAIRTAQTCASQVIKHKGALVAFSDLA